MVFGILTAIIVNLVPMHMIHTIALGKRVTLKVNPKKREDIYIQNEYGIL